MAFITTNTAAICMIPSIYYNDWGTTASATTTHDDWDTLTVVKNNKWHVHNGTYLVAGTGSNLDYYKIIRSNSTSNSTTWPTATNCYSIDYETGNCTTTMTGGTGYASYLWADSEYYRDTRNPKEKLKALLAARMAPAGIVKNRTKNPILPTSDLREIRARETLRRVVGEKKYAKFLKDGYVSVKNQISQRIYQIFPGHEQTRVYENGQMVQMLCIVLKGDFTPTDSMIVRYLLAINNEEKLWKLANKNRPLPKYQQPKQDMRLLPEIFKEYKKNHAA